MDPITTSIIAAVTTTLGNQALKDGYEALKGALKQKFGAESDVVEAVDKLEKKPDSEGRKATLQEEVNNAKVNDDREILNGT